MSALTAEQIKALNAPTELEFIDTEGVRVSVLYTECDTVAVLDEDLDDDQYTDAKLIGLWLKNGDYHEINMNDQYDAGIKNQELIWDLFQTM